MDLVTTGQLKRANRERAKINAMQEPPADDVNQIIRAHLDTLAKLSETDAKAWPVPHLYGPTSGFVVVSGADAERLGQAIAGTKIDAGGETIFFGRIRVAGSGSVSVAYAAEVQ